jgi:hypothetical protein
MSLFKKLPAPDRRQTMLAHRVKYWPFYQLSDAGKDLINWKTHKLMRKSEIELNCSESKTALFYAGRMYPIVWAFNNVPTEAEWYKCPDDRLIYCEFRTSPAIPETAVVVLSFSGRVKQEIHGAPL